MNIPDYKSIIIAVIVAIFTIHHIIVHSSSFFHWVRCKCWVPKYVHFISAIALAVGIFIATLDFNNQATTASRLTIAAGFPLSVYLIFGFYGGGIVAKERKLNDFLILDRGMNMKETLHVFRNKFEPYIKSSFDELASLHLNRIVHVYRFSNGRQYDLTLHVEPADFEADYEDDKEFPINKSDSLLVTGRLVFHDGFLYKPESFAVFIKNRDGSISADGLAEYLRMQKLLS